MFQHLYRVAHSLIRERQKIHRSWAWERVRDAYLVVHPACAACGTRKRVQVHHIEPYHLKPELELNPSNFIPLCMGPNECHLRIGHGEDFRAYCPQVVDLSAVVLATPQKRSAVELSAKIGRKYEAS